MDKCEITIRTLSEGKLSVSRSSGYAQRTAEGVLLQYRQEGDCVELEAGRGFLTVRREGNVCYSAFYSTQREGELVLRLGDGEGRVPVRTYRCETQTDGGIGVRLDYEIRYPGRSQKISMKIAVKISSEEK